MQSVNDDMDELFRSAAENYPLDTNSADWNKVLSALQGQTQAKTISEKKENKNGRLLWLLLLLPLGLICNQLYSPGIANNKNEISKASAGNESLTPATKNVQQQNTISNTNAIDKTKTVDPTAIGSKGLNDKNKTEKSVESFAQLHKASFSSKTPNLKTSEKVYVHNDVVSTGKERTQDFNNKDVAGEEMSFNRPYVSQIAFSKLSGDLPPTIVSRSLTPLVNLSEQNLKQPIQVQRRKKFYFGIMGGVDATTIKFQKIDSAGAIYGALLGYQLNKKWSIETGIYLEKKYYYTEGKYFNTTKAQLPSSYRIEDVTGNCKMFEVPVSIRYNFSQLKNSTWFATAGISSYFMMKQGYGYNYYYGSTGTMLYHKYYGYDASSNEFFSNISLSVGYTHRLGNFADLRIEPYLKAPTSGMGIGSLRLFSTGLQLGLTRKF
jgi:hypothetical protein